MSTNPVTRQLRDIIRPLVGLAVITAILLILAPTFRQGVALRDVFENSTVLFIMAAGTTVVLISGGLDLSIGSILALASVVTGSLLLAEQPVALAVLAGLGIGAICGLLNGLIIVKTGIPTLIATLGTALIYRGFGNMIGAGKDMSRFPENFKWLGAGWVGPLVISLITFFAIWFILSKTRLGFNAYAIGGNEEVARLSGIPVNFDKVTIYAIGGFCAALASIVQTSRLNFAHVNRGTGHGAVGDRSGRHRRHQHVRWDRRRRQDRDRCADHPRPGSRPDPPARPVVLAAGRDGPRRHHRRVAGLPSAQGA